MLQGLSPFTVARAHVFALALRSALPFAFTGLRSQVSGPGLAGSVFPSGSGSDNQPSSSD